MTQAHAIIVQIRSVLNQSRTSSVQPGFINSLFPLRVIHNRVIPSADTQGSGSGVLPKNENPSDFGRAFLYLPEPASGLRVTRSDLFIYLLFADYILYKATC